MEIQGTKFYYNGLSIGHGEKFYAEPDKRLNNLKTSPLFLNSL